MIAATLISSKSELQEGTAGDILMAITGEDRINIAPPLKVVVMSVPPVMTIVHGLMSADIINTDMSVDILSEGEVLR